MAIKKAELHVHLEGTISPALAHKLAQRNQLTIPQGLISADGTHYLSRDFLDFLNVYDTLAALIKTPEDYYDITLDYLRTNALHDAIYIEMMYSPDHAEQSSGIPSIEHLIAIQEAIDTAEADFGIIGRIIITAVRHFGVDSAIHVAKQAAKGTVPCVTGFGLGGDEIHFPPRLFKDAYQIAASSGLYCTVHAGEFAPASGVMEAIAHLPIQRIGHGVRAMESADTMALLKEKRIALELCPSSNIQLGLFPDFKSHPFPAFLQSGIPISLNSDDPPFMRTTLANEYALTQEAYQYDDATMTAITRMAIESAFVDERTRNKLRLKLQP